VVFVINWHEEIIHFGHFHTIFGTPKCQISIFNSFSSKKKFEKNLIFFFFFLDEEKCFSVCCIVVKSAENLENCGITFRNG
jgi:hypothetical protein